jgi:photosystem II stability/assembly factor-like uncharacterized protein
MKKRIYAGAGHYSSNVKHFQGGLFRTSPGNREWQPLTRGLPEQVEARAFAVHPTDPNVVFVGTQDGPYRTTDGGEHWERTGFPDRNAVVWSITYHPTRPNVMYAGTAPVALYRSEDGGDTWKKLPGAKSPEHCKMGFPTRTIRISIDAARPDHIYAGLEVSGVIASTDGGDTWTDLSTPIIKLAEKPHLKSRIGSDIDSEGMLDSHAITVGNKSTAFLATRMGLFRSDDEGATWQDMEIGRFSPLTYCRDVVVSPQDSKVMYAALSPAARSHDGSLYRSADAGETWKRFDHDIKANATMMSATVDRKDPARVYCASRCGQIFGTEDAGKTWSEYRLPENVQDVYAVACS